MSQLQLLYLLVLGSTFQGICVGATEVRLGEAGLTAREEGMRDSHQALEGKPESICHCRPTTASTSQQPALVPYSPTTKTNCVSPVSFLYMIRASE